MKILYVIILCVLVAGGAFFGGMQFQKSQPLSQAQLAAAFQNRTGGNFRNGTGRTGQQRLGGIAAGQILSNDGQSLTLKLQDGGSKIVFLSASTTVERTSAAKPADLKADAKVVVRGTANTDGSVSASTIQLVDQLPTIPAGQGFSNPTSGGSNSAGGNGQQGNAVFFQGGPGGPPPGM